MEDLIIISLIIINLGLLLLVAYQSRITGKSVPPELLGAIFAAAKWAASQTTTDFDDKALKEIEKALDGGEAVPAS